MNQCFIHIQDKRLLSGALTKFDLSWVYFFSSGPSKHRTSPQQIDHIFVNESIDILRVNFLLFTCFAVHYFFLSLLKLLIHCSFTFIPFNQTFDGWITFTWWCLVLTFRWALLICFFDGGLIHFCTVTLFQGFQLISKLTCPWWLNFHLVCYDWAAFDATDIVFALIDGLEKTREPLFASVGIIIDHLDIILSHTFPLLSEIFDRHNASKSIARVERTRLLYDLDSLFTASG